MITPADDAGALVAFVRTRDAACPVCSYNLRGLKAPVCPECAARLHLQVGSENLHVGPWFAGVVSFALALGFDSVASLIVATMLALHPPPSRGQAWPAIVLLLVLGALGAACAVGLGVMFRRRRAWTMLPLRRQRIAAAAIFLATGLAHGIAGLYLSGLL